MHSKIKSEMQNAFENVYDHHWYILGNEVDQFEQDYASFNQTKYCIGVSNGLDALFLALKACNIDYGDEVIVPSNTYIATVLAVSYLGALPVFVEPDINTYNIDPSKIEDAVTSRTKAIIPVNLYGQCCEMQSIMELSNKYKLFVIEDNAQSQGSSFNSKMAGSWGHINATSFYPGKNLGALGDAGAITTDNFQLAERIKVLRNYGSQKKYFNEVIGHNMRLDELQAAFLRVKLKSLLDWTKERQQIASWYDEALCGLGDLVLPKISTGATHVYHLYVIRSEKRNALQNFLNEKGIGTLIHYPVPPYLQEAYQSLGYTKGSFPIAEKIADTCLSLPIWPGMQKDEIDYISETIREFF
ncbi:MAG: DegT/DnrJ/EryC1/StrS family aminotransferase [Sediminibacterium sp.]|uniref:DegT/DnrJ/EryC1/StrS family aminotransferase n=1 Tax=Sediminibacterium sp. TaxID=1917865 RepID=UPI002ABA9F9F|nr:DegT/DnrJ/EryC1/StrS family aminotransferase [Sediminibacterium sp.]MDZ4070740.1 DegT/DnrJ/EryC1/StrS family aminotransferase [Sediminibacterium sp.]